MNHRLWNILLVDDDQDDFILTRSLLSEIKTVRFSLDWVNTYEDGLSSIQNNDYDVCLIDYHLGEQDGLELVREVVAAGCSAPLILMTGQGSYAVDIEAMHAGATDYLVKGEFNAPLLERTIRYAIGNKQAEEALRKAHNELEQRVKERTRALAEANEKLRAEIKERQRAEEALRKSEARFRTLAESTSSAIFILEDNLIHYANPAVKIITGYTPDELLGLEFWEIAHPAYQAILKKSGLANQWMGYLDGVEKKDALPHIPSRYEIKLLTKKGEERWVDLSMGNMELEGRPALVVTAFDITERDLAEQAMRKAQSELEERIARRTDELQRANIELASANEKLAQANAHLARVNQQLTFQLGERQRSAEEREHLLLEVDRQRQRADQLAQTLEKERARCNQQN